MKEHPVLVEDLLWPLLQTELLQSGISFTSAAQLSIFGLIHMLGATPNKVPFYNVYIIPVLIRSIFWRWNYLRGTYIRNFMVQYQEILSSYVSQ